MCGTQSSTSSSRHTQLTSSSRRDRRNSTLLFSSHREESEWRDPLMKSFRLTLCIIAACLLAWICLSDALPLVEHRRHQRRTTPPYNNLKKKRTLQTHTNTSFIYSDITRKYEMCAFARNENIPTLFRGQGATEGRGGGGRRVKHACVRFAECWYARCVRVVFFSRALALLHLLTAVFCFVFFVCVLFF